MPVYKTEESREEVTELYKRERETQTKEIARSVRSGERVELAAESVRTSPSRVIADRRTSSASGDAEGPLQTEHVNRGARKVVFEPGVTLVTLPDGSLELRFSAARNKSGAAMLTVFAAVWSAGLVWIAPSSPAIFQVFLAPFFLVALLLWMVVPIVWFQRIVVQARRGELSVRTSVLGLGSRRVLTVDAIESMAAETKGRVNDRALWAIRVHRKKGRPVSAGNDLHSKETAQALTDRLWRVLIG